ncbi:hypothetical protein [Alicyclobacillus sp.]|uniref:hypothetical protein n=1 Tax=Alicyclobacillus sp. TaxID=61169 RepID=UPI0025BAAD4D|nr:hypothetical protein [Alicyclobacillus sp.]MCL6516320.1 hypothetical protein [Alicyclobacillus sp.]
MTMKGMRVDGMTCGMEEWTNGPTGLWAFSCGVCGAEIHAQRPGALYTCDHCHETEDMEEPPAGVRGDFAKLPNPLP